MGGLADHGDALARKPRLVKAGGDGHDLFSEIAVGQRFKGLADGIFEGGLVAALQHHVDQLLEGVDLGENTLGFFNVHLIPLSVQIRRAPVWLHL